MNKYTLFSIVGAGLLASSAVMAAADPAVFQAEKDREIANMQERIQLVQERLSCVQAAADHAALVACHKAAHERGKDLEARIKAHRDEKKAVKAAREAKKGEVAPAIPAPAPAVPTPAVPAPTAPAMP